MNEQSNEKNVCQKCGQTNDSNKRLIVEICGHIKCRDCFIKEENGCEECSHCNFPSRNELHLKNRYFNEQSLIKKDLEDIDRTPAEDSSTSAKDSSEKNENGLLKKKSKKCFEYPSHLTCKEIDGKKLFHCAICDKKFKSLSNRKYHFYCDSNRIKPWNCEHCNKTFATKGHLSYHSKMHTTDDDVEQKHNCHICSKEFQRLQSLRKHIAQKHEQNFKFSCDICDQSFMYKNGLEAHKNRHDNISPFICDICSKGFSTKSNLKQHTEIHKDKATVVYTCEKCQKTFNYMSSLRAHQLTHTNVNRFECDDCHKKFYNQKSFNRHFRGHSSLQLYKCTLCNTRSYRRDNIIRHIRNLHVNENVEKLIQNIICVSEKKDDMELTSKSDDTVPSSSSSSSPPYKSIGDDDEKEKTKKCLTNNTDNDVGQNYCSVIKYTGRAAQNENSKIPKSSIERPTCHLIDINQRTESLAQDYFDFVIKDNAKTNCTALNIDVSNDVNENQNEMSLENMKIYRQLLSPYLKPPQEVLNKPKYLNNQSRSKTIEIVDTKQIRKPFKKGTDHLEIYRRILLPDHDDNVDDSNTNNSVKVCDKNINDTRQIQNELNNCNGDQQNKEHFTEMHWRKRTSQHFNYL